MELISTLEACAPRPKPFSSGGQYAPKVQWRGFGFQWLNRLFVYKGVGIAPVPTCVSRAFAIFSPDRRDAEK